MNNSKLFKDAHAMTKAIIQKGDCYRTTFGLCLKRLKAELLKRHIKRNGYNASVCYVPILPHDGNFKGEKVYTFNSGKLYKKVNPSLTYVYNIEKIILVLTFITSIIFILGLYNGQ